VVGVLRGRGTAGTHGHLDDAYMGNRRCPPTLMPRKNATHVGATKGEVVAIANPGPAADAIAVGTVTTSNLCGIHRMCSTEAEQNTANGLQWVPSLGTPSCCSATQEGDHGCIR